MSKRTLDDAMAHAAIIRQNGPRYDREETPHEFDVVLLADEILRLRAEMEIAYYQGLDNGYAAGYSP